MSYSVTKRTYVLRKTALSKEKRQKHADKWLKQEDMKRQDDNGLCAQQIV
jgi:hypothetical protein